MADARNGRVWPERLLFLAIVLLVPICLHQVFAVVPTEQKMGVVQRIFYFHVPSALAAFLGVALCAVCSALYLWKRDPRYDRIAHASAELGVLFCGLVLITGPIWARPVWGVWWTGEVRLTSTLVLWLIFVAYLILRQNAENREQAARWGAVVAIVGFLDVPIIYKSVEWWRGLHPKVLRVSGGGGLEPSMERALTWCTVTFALLFSYLLVQRCRLGRLQEEIETLSRSSAAASPATAGRSGGGS